MEPIKTNAQYGLP